MSSRDFACIHEISLAKILEKNVELLVLYSTPAFCSDRTDTNCATYEMPPGYRALSQFTGSEATSYNVVTDMDGYVQAILGSRDSRGLVEPWINPVDLILVPYLAGKAVALASRAAVLTGEAAASAAELGMGAKSAIWTLARRGSARLAAGARAVASRVFRREVEVTEGMIVGEQLTGSVTKEQMEAYLSNLRNTRSFVDRLVKARGLQADELTAETKQAMEEWAKQPGKTLKWLKDGVVQKATGMKGNTASMSIFENTLCVEETAIANPTSFYQQVAHDVFADTVSTEVAASTAHGVAWVGAEKGVLNTSLDLLDIAVKHGWEQMLQFLRGMH